MDLRQLTDDVSVCGQIGPDDLADLAASGFRSVICNRPDGEAMDQPGFDVIRQAAEVLGLSVRYIPIFPGRMGPEDVQAFRTALDELPGPVLAYCRSGARSTTLFQAAAALP
jgi:sulfide:quinone oxidoreductase